MIEAGNDPAPAGADGLWEQVASLRAPGTPTVDALVTLLWDEIHQVAAWLMNREGKGRTFQATELVNEAYLRLRSAGIIWNDRSHVLRTFALVMRRYLIGEAHKRNALKRGGGAERVRLVTLGDAREWRMDEVIALDGALRELSEGPGNQARQARLLELVFFVGATWAEAATTLGVSERQVHRDWKYARVWLKRRIGV